MSLSLAHCPSTISSRKKDLAIKIQQLMGADIVAQVIKLPRWKDDLITSRERLACKHDRAH